MISETYMDNNVITTMKKIEMGTSTENVNIDNVDTDNIGTNNINIGNRDKDIQNAMTLFDSCKYNEAEQTFANIKGSDATAWRILCCIVTDNIGKKGGRVATLLQESIKNNYASIEETVTLLKMLISEYGSAIGKKTKNRELA